MGLLLFDADNDNDLDLYCASGGYELAPNTGGYQDRLYLNNGKGQYSIDTSALPKNLVSKSCVRAADYDHDGDLDLFVAGRVEPWNYPKPVSSFIFRNNSKPGHPLFTDVSKQVAPALTNLGLACDAVFTDFNNDGWQDLIIVGEWMQLKLFRNNRGHFTELADTGLENMFGWWQSIVPGDFDNDGDIDYIVGNLGKNSFYRANSTEPLRIFGKDFNADGNYDALISTYLQASQQNKKRQEYPVNLRDDLTKQIISFRSKFQNYNAYAVATFPQLFSSAELQGAVQLQANYLGSAFIRNLGGNKFKVEPLPPMAQLSCINGMVADDFNGDGILDVALIGNDFGADVYVGRYDALNGLVLLGNGKGSFNPLSIKQSGIFVPGNAKALVKLIVANKYTLVASQNKADAKAFSLPANRTSIAFKPGDVVANIHMKNNSTQRYEINYGASFLSQSARLLLVSKAMQWVDIVNTQGQVRRIVCTQ